MAEIDDRLRVEIAPHPWQGEQVLFMAGIFRPAHQEDVFAIASTPFRSFIFECATTFMTGAPAAPRDGGKRIVIEHAHVTDFIVPNVGLLGDQRPRARPGSRLRTRR